MRGKRELYYKKKSNKKRREKNYQNLVLFWLPVQPEVHFTMMNQLERNTYSRCFLCLSPLFTSCFIQRGYSTEINDIPSVNSKGKNIDCSKFKRETNSGQTAQDKTQTSL